MFLSQQPQAILLGGSNQACSATMVKSTAKEHLRPTASTNREVMLKQTADIDPFY